MLQSRCLSLALVVAFACRTAAEISDWAEETSEVTTGATRDYYNAAGKLAWKHFLGDWHDANGKAQGDKPYATAQIVDNDQRRWVEWDVLALVRQWRTGEHLNKGFFLRAVGTGGKTVFCSREHAQAEYRPRLVLAGEHGSQKISASADTYLTKSTFRGQGLSNTLSVSGSPDNTLLRFELEAVERLGRLSGATLRLYTTKQYGTTNVGVFRCSQGHEAAPSDPIPGLAARHPRDENIATNEHVVFAARFETETWHKRWSQAAKLKVVQPVADDEQRKFVPLDGKALRVKIAQGEVSALNTLFKFAEESGQEPEEIYFRYYLRLADDWNPTKQGGKLPGISGTYGVAGWGGRRANGRNGWSARGSFGLTIPAGNPLAGRRPIGAYCYHADMQGRYGDIWGWHINYRGFLENNRWYCIEQHVKLNTPGKNNGILQAWVDGRAAFEKCDIRFRDANRLKIEQVWMNVYHGGTQPSPYDQHLYIDNVVIANRYIGPLLHD